MAKKVAEKSLIKTQSNLNGRKLVLETGQLAPFADGAVLVRFGDTAILATAVVSDEPKEDAAFFPLLVDYEERLYASGKISGSRFYKREGRPSEDAVLMARMIDRPIRPLFPKSYRNDIQIIVTVLSYDPESEVEVPAIIGASAALSLTGAPFQGPIGAVKIGLIDDKFVVNPTTDQLKEESKLNLTVVGNEQRILMVEGEADQIPSDKLLTAFKLAHRELQATIKSQEDLFKKAVPIKKREFISPDPGLKKRAEEEVGAELDKVIKLDRTEREEQLDKLKDVLKGALEGDYKQQEIKDTFQQLYYQKVRERILKEGVRPDGRKLNEIRPIGAELPELPRSHGAGLFQRGKTQLLSIVTLASLSKEGLVETMEVEDSQQFFHHYNFPPFSVNEIMPMRGPGRREIGHSRLGEKALKAVIPAKDKFPYVIRTVSEALSSDGSTSMAAVCSSSLALMAAGVPIESSVSGIAIGLIAENDDRGKIKKYKILTDIQGLEDFLGDMDLKVAGTKKGITVLQLDVKISGINFKIIEEALKRADQARAQIRKKMEETIAQPRDQISDYAPQIKVVKIDPTRIGDLIGPGGKIVNKIIELTGCEINIEDDGVVSISTVGEAGKLEEAVEMVKGLGQKPDVGRVYQGTVTRVEDFGAFVEYLPGKEGLVHISELADHRVNKVSDVVKVGDKIKVMLIEVDGQGRVNLSLKAAK
jgi:polyribonucleotide nucleotidyltransferase